MCRKTPLASHKEKTSALRRLSAPRGRAACNCRVRGRAMKAEVRPKQAKGTCLSWMWCAPGQRANTSQWTESFNFVLSLMFWLPGYIWEYERLALASQQCLQVAALRSLRCLRPCDVFVPWRPFASATAMVTAWPRMLLLGSHHCADSCVAASEIPSCAPCDKHTPVNDHQNPSPTPLLDVCRQADPTTSADTLRELQPQQRWLSPGCVTVYALAARKPAPAVRHPDLWGLCTAVELNGFSSWMSQKLSIFSTWN